MKENNNIEFYLKENKPPKPEDENFLIEMNARLDAVEGIKTEVDRQRRIGRAVLIATLFIGLAAGLFTAAFIILHPVKPSNAGQEFFKRILDFIYEWRTYIIFPIAIISIILPLVLAKSKREALDL